MATTNLLSPRFDNDKKSIIDLNTLQKKTRDKVRKKIDADHYSFTKVECPICGNEDEFDVISKKDRYGLYHPVKACRVCGLVQTNPRMSEESYGEFYDSEYRLLYDGTNGYAESQFKSQKQKAKKVYRYLESNIPEKLQNAKILDVGCGPGGMPAYFQEQGHQVAGCDLDSNAIAYGTNQDVPLQVGTVEELDIDWKPDIVILSHIVEHFLSPVDDLKSIRELLHKNSVVYIELPGIKWLSPFRRYYNSDFLRQLQNAHTYYFTKTTLENIMEKSGFDTIKIDESIQGIFTPSQNVGNPDFETDYPDVIEHLEKLEKWNKWGVTPIPTSPHDVYTHPKILSLLRRSGMYPYAKRAYNQFLE